MPDTTNNPLIENEHVKELMSALKENGKDASGLTALLGYVDSMEKQLNTAVGELTSMRYELNNMREERDHPVRTALQNASNTLEAKINETKLMLDALKNKIVEGCKNALEAFKTKGAAALNGITKFFKIKPALESIKNKMQGDIKNANAAIEKIESMSTKYHTAGMHLKNVGRTLRGKEPLTAVKPNGKLAKLMEVPFRVEKKCLNAAVKDAEKAIASLDSFDKSVPQKAAGEKPSAKDTMKRLAEKIAGEKKEAPAVDKSKRKEAEL